MQTRNMIFGLGMAVAAAGLTAAAVAQNNGEGEMSFFVTSVGSGEGGNLGGLEGADAHCQSLAAAVGAGDRVWRAYLSTIDLGGGEGGDARDRIGEGPWFNAEGVLIAANLDDLHTEGANNINKETALTEAGAIVPGRGDSPNQHDILTGTLQDGTAANATCINWTSSSNDQSTIVGHTDLQGNPSGINFWNYSHGTRGCSQEALVGTGGAGYFYCFAAQ